MTDKPIRQVTDPDHPYHHASDGRPPRAVFLDGVELSDVERCHTRDGWVVQALRGASGSFLFDRKRGTLVTHKLFGVVTVKEIQHG